MEGVRARLQDHVGNGATSPSELCGIVAGAHVDGLNCLGRGNIDLQQAGTLIVVHAFNLQIVE